MAEFVNQRIEDMLTELEQMKRIELYTPEEVRTISKKRKEFEYKIQRRVRCKEDFLKYIAYECILLQNIRLRRDQYSIKEKKNDIEYTISKRIMKLYKELISRFSNDIEIWLNFVEFCKVADFKHAVTSYLDKLVQIHGDKPKIWQLASRWEYEEMNSLDNARKFLLKGIQRHLDNQDLYIDALRIELLVAEALKELDRDAQMQRVNVVIQNAFKHIDTVDFIIKIIMTVDSFEFASDIRLKLFTILWENHQNNSDTWNFIANFQLQGKDVSGFNWILRDDVAFPSDYPDNLRDFLTIHEVAISTIPTKKSALNYLNSAIKLIEEEEFSDVMKLQTINRALEKCHTLKFLDEEHYELWMDLLCSDNERRRSEIIQILEEGCENLPNSEFLWTERLKRCADNSNDLLNLFKKARKVLPANDATSIWKFVIENTRDLVKLKKLFEESMSLSPKMSAVVKPAILKSLYEHNGIELTRVEYKSMAITPPFVLQLHEAMIDIERSEKIPDIKHLKYCHDLATQQFGKQNENVWLQYVVSEIKYGNLKNCSLLYTRACSNLDDSLVSVFIEKYTDVIKKN